MCQALKVVMDSHFTNHHKQLSITIEEDEHCDDASSHDDTPDRKTRLQSPRGAVKFQVPEENKRELDDSSASTQQPKHPRQKPPKKKLAKQVSLGTGFANMKKQTVNKDKLLSRSGASFSGFSSSTNVNKEDYALFRTRSGIPEMQNAHARRSEQNNAQSKYEDNSTGTGNISAGRYFDALKGPELDVLKDTEDILLPMDKKWPFLLRFPIGCFGVSLGLGSQAILWKTISTTSSVKALHGVARFTNIVLWFMTLVALVAITFTYIMKCILYLEAVKREYYHPVRVNFFFAPWIVIMFLTLGVPPSISQHIHPAIWCVEMAPLLALELKIYGQWLSGGKRRLSKVANPSSHLSVVGNFVGALLAAKVGWFEPAKFLWAVGLGHYLVLFVTLYQRLPTSEALPQELHPVFFLFIAAPCTASIAWEKIYGSFDSVSRIVYFVALFLYCSLVVRINFFRGFRFSLAWWAYSFPMTAASVATIRYAESVDSVATKVLALCLFVASSMTVATLLVTTVLHAWWGTLFPNDLAIAITDKRLKKTRGLRKRVANLSMDDQADNSSKKEHFVHDKNFS